MIGEGLCGADNGSSCSERGWKVRWEIGAEKGYRFGEGGANIQYLKSKIEVMAYVIKTEDVVYYSLWLMR